MFARAGVEHARVGTLNHQDRHPFAERGAALELFTSGSGPRLLGEFCCVRWHLHAADPDDGRSDAEAGHGDADRDRLRVSDAETSCSALRSGGRAVNGWDSGAPSRSLSPYTTSVGTMPFGQRLDGRGAFCGRGDLAIDHESNFSARLRSRSCIIDGEAVGRL